jgi:hypothetical protein
MNLTHKIVVNRYNDTIHLRSKLIFIPGLIVEL